MRRSVTVAILLTFVVHSAVFAQAWKTGKLVPPYPNQLGVTGLVTPGSGFVQVRIYPGNFSNPILSYADKSFVTFLINGDKYFTNNNLVTFPANAQRLTDGILTQIGDTIRCTWFDKDGVDLIQEIYPVVFEKSEQIVFRWKAVNHNATPTAVSLQYLLDLNINGNDQGKVLTREGYRPDWFQFNNNADSVPPFFVAFERDLPNPPTFNPGISGQGYLDNTYYKLGLTKPSRMTVGDWTKFIDVLWGPPSPIPTGNYGDAAILFEFPGGYSPKDKEVLLAATSYGTGEFERCTGQLFAFEFYPYRLRWQGSNPSPNPFTIDMYVFNPSKKAKAPNTSVTLNVGNNLTILGPSPVTNFGKTQMQSVAGGGNIPPLGVGTARWNVQADTMKGGGGNISSLLKFTASSQSLGYPIFINEGGNGTDTCDHTIIVRDVQSAAENSPNHPFEFDLIPNPAKERFTIHLSVERSSSASVRIVDMVGREIRRVGYATVPVGDNDMPIDASDLADGSYYVILEIGGQQYSKLLKIVR